MKKYIFILSFFIIQASCTSEIDGLFYGLMEKTEDKTVFHATTETASAPATKTFADASMRVLWNARVPMII